MRPSEGRRTAARLVLSLLVLGAVYAGLATFVGRHVAANTRVDGVSVGGLSPEPGLGHAQARPGRQGLPAGHAEDALGPGAAGPGHGRAGPGRGRDPGRSDRVQPRAGRRLAAPDRRRGPAAADLGRRRQAHRGRAACGHHRQHPRQGGVGLPRRRHRARRAVRARAHPRGRPDGRGRRCGLAAPAGDRRRRRRRGAHAGGRRDQARRRRLRPSGGLRPADGQGRVAADRADAGEARVRRQPEGDAAGQARPGGRRRQDRRAAALGRARGGEATGRRHGDAGR